MDEIDRWFRALSSPLRQRLMRNSAVELRGDEIVEVSRSGVILAAAWFPAVQDGPSRFHLPHDVAGFVEDVTASLDDWWSGLSEDDRAAWLVYVGGPIPARIGATTPLAYTPVADDKLGVVVNPVIADYLTAAGHRDRLS